MTIWLIRHGRSRHNDGISDSSTDADIGLTDLGLAQAEEIAGKISRRPDLIVESPYLRARLTAAPTRRRWPDAPAEVWPEVREFDLFGPVIFATADIAEHKRLDTEYFAAGDSSRKLAADAESWDDLMARARGFLARAQARRREGFIVVFSHCRFINAVQVASSATGGENPLAAARSLPIVANGQIVEIVK
ncbi:hypothetical protein FACS1894186_6830 [Alphaproteobacteria bacterium]|nr:hypothetical protein FACS1894186_6830 [Alphaproteobacteria bacterium]